MNTKKASVNKSIPAGYFPAESVLKELEETLYFEIHKSLIEADAGDFASHAEVQNVIDKWKKLGGKFGVKNKKNCN
jgi:predicted transcriptional regulator